MNDLLYNELVATPGFELDFAVGTTYSLDAQAYLALGLAFARLGETDTDGNANIYGMIRGVMNAGKKIALFFNRGGLKPPVRSNPLYAMLDKSVFEVYEKRRGHELANFHPKIWVIKEHLIEDPSIRQIKLVVLSRNLTLDTSLDIATSISSRIGNERNPDLIQKHEPLKKFLLELATYANKEKSKKIRKLADDIDFLERFKLESPYEDYDLIPLHFGMNLNEIVDIKKDMQTVSSIVVSPFIDFATLDWMTSYGTTSPKILITRLESVTPEIFDLYSRKQREIWVPNPELVSNDISPMNLHAKMYFTSYPRNSSDKHLWLGSSNATKNAFERNSEFLLRLKYETKKHLFSNFKDIFCDEKKQLFIKLEKLPEINDASNKASAFEMQVRKHLICNKTLRAKVTENHGTYLITIKSGRIKPIDGKIYFAPIQEPNNRVEFVDGSCIIEVSNPSHLSEFYIICAEPSDPEESPVTVTLKIETSGIPEDRDNLILNNYFKKEDDFLNYVELILTDTPLSLMESWSTAEDKNGSCAPKASPFRAGSIYESMLRLAASNPDRLRELDEIISRLEGGNAVSPSFISMYQTIKEAIKK